MSSGTNTLEVAFARSKSLNDISSGPAFYLGLVAFQCCFYSLLGRIYFGTPASQGFFERLQQVLYRVRCNLCCHGFDWTDHAGNVSIHCFAISEPGGLAGGWSRSFQVFKPRLRAPRPLALGNWEPHRPQQGSP